MVETHVAGFARLRLARLVDREGMPRMTGVARRNTVMVALLGQRRNLLRRLDANLVATAAAFHAFGFRHGLIVNGWHRLHRSPRHGMLALLELRDLFLVALGASVGSRN